jgi:hypothetical protein
MLAPPIRRAMLALVETASPAAKDNPERGIVRE